MADEKQEEKKEDLVDDYLRRTGRSESAPVTFGDLKAVMNHELEPKAEKPAATS